MIKMWNEVVDLSLCCRDKFVLRGDGSTGDFAQEVGNLKNYVIVSRTENHEIKLERFGQCFGRIFQVEEEFDRLFVEIRKCFGFILSREQSTSRNFEVRLECSMCATDLQASALASNHLDEVWEKLEDVQVCKGCNRTIRAAETIENLSELVRVFYLFKKFGKSTNKLEEELGDFVNFPRNQITVADNEHRRYLKGKTLNHLAIQRGVQQITAKEAVFQCCFQPRSEVMVSKYLHCRMTDYSPTFKPRFVKALKNLPRALAEDGNMSDISHFVATKVINHENVKEVAQQIHLLLDDCDQRGTKAESLKRTISFLENENSRECNFFEEFLREIQTNKISVYSAFVRSVEQFKSKIESDGGQPTPQGTLIPLAEASSFSTLFVKLEKLKKRMNPYFNQCFSEELAKMQEKMQEMTSTWEKVKAVMEMISKVSTLISRANEMEVTQTLRLQRNKLQVKKGATFSEVALHSFEDVFVNSGSDLRAPTSVIVDLMNVYDGPAHFAPVFVSSHHCFRKDNSKLYGEEIRANLLLFLQIAYGIQELKNLGIVHRNIKLKSTVMLARSQWVCLSGFGMATKCPTEEMILSSE